MVKIDEKEWIAFTVEDIFSEIKATKGKTTGQLVKGDDVPYIAAAKTNNGFAAMCSSKEHPEWVSDGNAIVFVQLGDGAAGLAHYIPMDFIGMSGKTSSGYNSELSEDNGVFIARCLSSNKAIFSHGHSWTGRRLLSTKTMLPVNAEGEPDYKYMTEYTQQKRKALQEKYRTYAEECIAKLGKHIKIPSISQKNWEAFLISDIFNILPGKRLVASDSAPGDRPFIGALDNSNGISRFVSDKNASLDSNVLGVNYNGNGMVIGFYHPYECIFSDDVKRFHLKHHEDNAFVLLFMKVAILQQKSKFGYLYKFNAERMANTRIMLPVTDDGALDYEYMEQYVKNLMSRKYKQYLAYLDSKEKTDTIATSD